MNKVLDLRPVLTQPESDFGKLMGQVLSPSRPLQSEEFLRGREEQLQGIKRALYQPGRHVLIHGLRGVGKSSLAQTAAFALSEGTDPIIIGCDSQSTFGRIVREIYDEAENRNPSVTERIKEVGAGFSRFGISLDGTLTIVEGSKSDPGSVNEAVRLLDFLYGQSDKVPIVVVDEFDQISEPDEQKHFANFVKQVSDKRIPVRFVFCGIGESAEALMEAHASADRYFHTVGLGQLPWEARFEIVQDSANRLGIEVDESTTIRIARISDGFPHYVHFISEKLYWRVFEAKNGGNTTAELFGLAMSDAANAMDMKLRGPYEKATQKYTSENEYENVLWAAADGHELRRRSSDIFESYQRIMSSIDGASMDRKKFNQRINSLKKESHAYVLSGTRQGWYEFSEKMLRGYVRLKAEQADVVLEGDHPEVTTSRSWRS